MKQLMKFLALTMLFGVLVTFTVMPLLSLMDKDVVKGDGYKDQVVKYTLSQDEPYYAETKRITQDEIRSVEIISHLILDNYIRPWELQHMQKIPLIDEVKDKMKVVIIPPHPEELMLKCRSVFEKQARGLHGERLRDIYQDALEHWQKICRFSTEWQLISIENNGDLYREKFYDLSQFSTNPEGGFTIERDYSPREPAYLLPNYAAFGEPQEERFAHLFSN